MPFRLPPIYPSVKEVRAEDTGWSVKAIDAPSVWPLTKGEGVTVAVIDTGVDASHRDLQGQVVKRIDLTGDPAPDHYHGTHVAGIIAANGDGTGRMTGVAPAAKLLDVRVLSSQGSGSDDWVAKGVLAAVENGADVINMSLGGPDDYAPLHEAVKKAVNAGVIVVCAAGNEGSGPDTIGYPGRYNETIAVTAVDENRNRAFFSSTGPEADVAAPGVDVPSTLPNNRYGFLSGTSMAAPHIAGCMALWASLQKKTGRKPLFQEWYNFVTRNVIDLEASGFDPDTGFGLFTWQKGVLAVAHKIVMTIGQIAYEVNGQERQMDVAPIIVEPGRTLVPVRFVAEGLGASVSWDGGKQQVTILMPR